MIIALLILATTTARLAAGTNTTPPPTADTYTIDGVTYYNVNSSNFDSSKKF